jgi:hypothetical protein
MARRYCFWVPVAPHDENGYVPAMITEGQAGYRLMLSNGESAAPWYWGDTREEALMIAAEANVRLGLSDEDVADIIASSLAA